MLKTILTISTLSMVETVPTARKMVSSKVLKEKRALDIDVTSKGSDGEWDSFVLQCIDPHHEQTSLWGDLQRLRGWEPVRLVALRGGRVIGGVQLLHKSIGRFARAGYINRGPLIEDRDPLIKDALLRAVANLARKLKLSYVAVVLPYSGGHLLPTLPKFGFFEGADFLPPRTAMMSTIVLDLSPDLNEILGGMEKTTRKRIRQSQGRGLSLRIGSEADMRTFAHLLVALCDRRGEKPNVPVDHFLEKLWQTFAHREMVELFIAELEKEPVAAMIVFRMGPWARGWRIGWSGAHGDARPNYFLYWEVIRWAKSAGCRYFDFVGFDTKMAHAIAAGRLLPSEKTCGASLYKLGFGGKVLPLYPRYCLFLNPVLRIFIQASKRSEIVSLGLQRLMGLLGIK